MAMTVEQAQVHNAKQMSDDKLLREFRTVTGFPERPAIRVAYIDVLRAEIAKRGRTEPSWT